MSGVVYSGDALALTLDNAKKLDHRYLYGPANQVLVDEVFNTSGQSTDVLWLLGDRQGSVRDVFDDNGVRRKRVGYDTFGEMGEWYYSASGALIPSTHAEAVDQLFYYTGQERDDATELQLHRARWYNPATGRWLSEDPSGFAGGGDANLYRYVGNNAPNRTDPTGLQQAGNPLAKLPGYRTNLGLVTSPVSRPFTHLAVTTPSYSQPVLSATTTIGSTRYASMKVPRVSKQPVSQPASSPGFFGAIGNALTGAANAIRGSANYVAGGIENLTTTGRSGFLGNTLAVAGGVAAHGVRLVGGTVGGVVDVPGTVRGTIDDFRQTKQVYDQYGLGAAAARQIGLLQGAEAYYGTDVLTGQPVDRIAKITEASARFGGAAGTAAGVGAGITRLATPNAVVRRTNAQLVEEVATRAERYVARKSVPGTPQQIGIEKHAYAQRLLDRYQDIYGYRGLQTEVSVINGVIQDYGTPGSVRLDVLEGAIRNPTAVYDYKFGASGLSPGRVNQIRTVTGYSPTVPVMQVRP